MKKIVLFLLVSTMILLVGCETTQEITINKDGSGSISNTSDMSNMVGMLKTMGNNDAEKIPNTDTTILLAGIADSITGLTAQQKKIINQGSMKLTMNMKDEKLIMKSIFPFQKLNDIQMLSASMPKVSEAMSKKLTSGEQMPSGLGTGEKPQIKAFDDFFDVNFTDKLISKTLNKAKYATASDDQYMQSLKQMSSMGSPINVNYIINLPRPAKKAEGKALKLSDDKKKVTVSVTSDDFFEDPSKFEYKIEY
ncbi:MAG TPA: hypothetical protein VGQ09_03940 [Chitinophagaceae bacterium]|jgi:hypothetical protein|nr:hypothetical protein [Chitinophagaceae bacterium]